MTPQTGRAWLGGVAAAGVGGLAYAAVVERRMFRLRHVTVPALSETTGRPLRILHLSDLHLQPGEQRLATFLTRCLRTGPDLVVATGDLLGHRDAVEPAVELLGALAGGDRPAVAVLGSHDVYAPRPKNPVRYLRRGDQRVHGPRHDTARFVSGLCERGWRVLDNERTVVDTAAGPVDVAALTDPHEGWDRPERLGPPPDGTAALRLGVVHAPYLRALDALEDAGSALVLAGHTHGGQLRVPGFGALVDNCDLPRRRARGLSRDGGRDGFAGPWLHVSAGLGESPYAPVRFACPREASVLDVVGPRP